jgi:sugar phosphate isomerase/epimerase
MKMDSISRRRFVVIAGGAAAAAAGAAILSTRVHAGPMGLPIGIQLYAVSKPLAEETAGTLKLLRTIGYREVEAARYAGHTAKEFRAMLDDAELTCPSIHLQMEQNIEAQFDDAKTFGAHYVVCSLLVDPGPDGKRPKLGELGVDGFKRMAVRLNDLGKKAKAAGLQYAYHNHNPEFEKMPDGLPGYDILIKETDPELVKFEVDCGWMVVAGANPVDYFKKYPGRFRMLHIKDFKRGSAPTIDLSGPGRPEGTDLGTGFIDYKPIFAAGKAAGIEHIFVEQEAPFAVSQMTSAKVDFAYVQKFS